MIKRGLISALGLVFSVNAFAAGFGIVDIQKVILSVEEGKSARANLEKEIKGKEKEFLSQKKDLDKMNKDWKAQAALMTEDARREKQVEFQEKFMALRNQEMKFQQELKKKEAEVTQMIAIKVAKMVNNMAKNKEIDVVFEANSSGLIYVKNPIDLTGDVIKVYDQEAKKVSKK
jgi:outer membrane protein